MNLLLSSMSKIIKVGVVRFEYCYVIYTSFLRRTLALVTEDTRNSVIWVECGHFHLFSVSFLTLSIFKMILNEDVLWIKCTVEFEPSSVPPFVVFNSSSIVDKIITHNFFSR